MPPPTVTAIIPLKAIQSSKTRMSPALSPADRALLLRRTFDRVAQAVSLSRLVADALVVVGDEEGRRWARHHGLQVMDEPAGEQGLNAAIAAADRALSGLTTLVLPADLPLVTGEDLDRVIAAAADGPRVVVAPTSDGGTGALVRAPGDVIAPRFGPDSAAVHQVEALRTGVPCVSLWVPGLALDLDQPSDIGLAGGWSAITAPRTLTT